MEDGSSRSAGTPWLAPWRSRSSAGRGPVRVRRARVAAAPCTPGDVLRERILSDRRITQDQLAKAMRVSRFSINQLVNGRRSVTAEMAFRLSRATSTTPEFWLDLQ